MSTSWRSPPSQLSVLRHEVHVWQIALEPLPGGSTRKPARQRIPTASIRSILRRYPDAGPQPQLVHDEAGKPSLTASPLDLRISISHSGALGLFALALGRDLGVDVEQLRPEVRALRLAERLFAPAEHRALRNLNQGARQQAFFVAWTRKEAYAKALGTGLGVGNDSGALGLDVLSERPPQPAETPRRLGSDSARSDSPADGWGFADIDLRAGYAGALVAAGQDWRLTCWLAPVTPPSPAVAAGEPPGRPAAV